MLRVKIDTSFARPDLDIIARANKKLVPEVQKALREAAKLVAQEARALIRAKRGAPSSPGESPATESGALARSIRYRQSRRRALGVYIQAAEFYGRFLETGRKAGSQAGRRTAESGRVTSRANARAKRTSAMAPRPFLTTALERRRETIFGMLTQAIVASLERISRE